MALREVLKFPDKRLSEVSTPIEKITDEIRELANDMAEVMYDEPGIGLAAPQVGQTVRLIVVDTEWTTEDAEQNPLVLVNPEIVEHSGQITWTEGCLSVPDFEADVSRASHVKLRASNLEGEDLEIDASELQAARRRPLHRSDQPAQAQPLHATAQEAAAPRARRTVGTLGVGVWRPRLPAPRFAWRSSEHRTLRFRLSSGCSKGATKSSVSSASPTAGAAAAARRHPPR